MQEDSEAVKRFKAGFNCAQCVFAHYADKMNIPAETAVKLATGFGAGMGRKQEICGAVSGGILTINALYGRTIHEPKEQQETAYSKVTLLMDSFEKEKGSCICRNILDGCDLSSAEGKARFSNERMIEMCYSCVDTVIRILDERILVDTGSA